MNTLRAKVTSKGQITLPKPLRDSLGIHEGDQLEFALTSKQEASLVKLKSPGSSSGILNHLGKKKAVSVTEMDKAIGEAINQLQTRPK